MKFVAFIGQDKESWGQVTALINRLECQRVIIVKDKAVKDFPSNPKCKIIDIDLSKSLLDLKNDMHTKLKKELSSEFEVALSLASGSGKEHMSLISALLNLPVGIKLVAFTKAGIEYIT